MLRESFREGKAGLEAVINQPDQRLAEVRLRLGLRIALGERVQVVVDREVSPGLSVALDAMRDSLKKKREGNARGCGLLGHRQATVRAAAAARKASRAAGPGAGRTIGGSVAGRTGLLASGA